jgi:hypothetical protein
MVFEILLLKIGFSRLIAIMKEFTGWLAITEPAHDCYFPLPRVMKEG